MGTFKQLQHKSLLSTPTTRTSSLLPLSRPLALTSSLSSPSRPLAPPSPLVAEPVALPSQERLERAARLGHSFARIPIFPPVSGTAEVNKAEQASAITTMLKSASTSVFASSTLHSPEATPTEEHAHSGCTSRFGHSFAGIPLFPRVQRKALLPSHLQEESQLGSRIHAARSSGRPLDKQTQERLEQGLGRDLSMVRVHTNNEADHLARSVSALAFTTGSDIFFRSGKYHPDSSQGLRLLAHEATHVAQQLSGRVSGVPRANEVSISDPDDRLEQAAEVKADQIAKGSMDNRGMTEGSGSPIHSQHFSPKADSFDRRGDITLRGREVQDIREPLVKAQEKGGHVQGNVLQRQIVLNPNNYIFKTDDQVKNAIRSGLGKSKIDLTAAQGQALEDIRIELHTMPDKFTAPSQVLDWIFANAETVTQWLTTKQHQYTWERTVYQGLQQQEAKKRAAPTVGQQQQAKKIAQNQYQTFSKQYQDYGKPLNAAICEQLLTKSAEVRPHLPTGQNSAAADAQTNATARNKFTTVYSTLTEAAEDLLYYLQHSIGEQKLWEYEPEVIVNKTIVQLQTRRYGWASQPQGQAVRQNWDKIEIALHYRGGAMPDIRHFTPIQ